MVLLGGRLGNFCGTDSIPHRLQSRSSVPPSPPFVDVARPTSLASERSAFTELFIVPSHVFNACLHLIDVKGTLILLTFNLAVTTLC